MQETIKTLIKITLVAAIITGYISCIINFLSCDFEAPYKGETLYGIGIFTGLGIILGWFNFGK